MEKIYQNISICFFNSKTLINFIMLFSVIMAWTIEFKVRHCVVKVRVMRCVRKFSPFTTVQTVRFYN